jgi:hypothetical protein
MAPEPAAETSVLVCEQPVRKRMAAHDRGIKTRFTDLLE